MCGAQGDGSWLGLSSWKTCSDSEEKLKEPNVMDCVLSDLDLIKEGVFNGMIQFCALLICHLQL